jgi:CDP-diacylglycerol--serine O-phosphatidyltransferase
MVSNLPLLGMKFKDFSIKNNLPRYLLVVIAVAAAVLLKWLAAPVLLVAYVILSLLFKNKSS